MSIAENEFFVKANGPTKVENTVLKSLPLTAKTIKIPLEGGHIT